MLENIGDNLDRILITVSGHFKHDFRGLIACTKGEKIWKTRKLTKELKKG